MGKRRAAYEIHVAGTEVVLAELLPSELLAVVKAVQGELSPTAADMEIPLEGIRRSIRRIGGQPVSYADLAGGLLKTRFRHYRDTRILTDAWGRIHNPGDGEAGDLLDTMVITDAGSAEIYTVTLPGFRPSPESEAAATRVVVFREQDVESVKVAARAADAFKSALGRALSVVMAAMRRSLVSVDGKTLTDVDAAGWDELFSVRETMLLSVAWESVHGGLAGGSPGGLKPVSGI